MNESSDGESDTSRYKIPDLKARLPKSVFILEKCENEVNDWIGGNQSNNQSINHAAGDAPCQFKTGCRAIEGSTAQCGCKFRYIRIEVFSGIAWFSLR